jgi:hypothetical protein
VLLVASIHRVALVDDLGEHGLAVRGDADHLAAPARAVEPQLLGGQRDHKLAVRVVVVVVERRATAVSALGEAVQRQGRRRLGGHRRRAPELRVLVARDAAVGEVHRVALAGLALEEAPDAAGDALWLRIVLAGCGYGGDVERQDLHEGEHHQ